MSLPIDDVLYLSAADIEASLAGAELELVDRVRDAYERHSAGRSAVPHSVFVRFPERPRDRIIALPAWLGSAPELAGIKWISSVPGNHERGIDRASAVMILNDLETGRARVVMEGSIVSAWRTAASAALAARTLSSEERPERVALVGCGRIQLEVLRFLRAVFPSLRQAVMLDTDAGAAARFADTAARTLGAMHFETAPTLEALFASAALVSLATTSGTPFIEPAALSSAPRGSTILHLSLRDLAPSIVLGAHNVVDDEDHVCRAETSLHLAEQEVGHRRFVHAALGDVTAGRTTARPDRDRLVVFSPFGLGVLDLVAADLVAQRAIASGRGTVLRGFFPPRVIAREESGR
ncbi:MULTISPECIES: 2,3-diaminopropionate biosynthesis protein SbnB [Sandaracinus]|uniref:2,3-diaminopropionate biosynthesis protein SbnB n=1 Tax=Sandaracinus TaxID=1055688 RepID=UPI001AF47750|nr:MULTISPECIES: 2,3-diaminopropionate biosynthesis protein SbnB [Sandaracinus]QRN75758.1 Pyridoxal-phosphate dependent enzyme family [Sandaracinus sp.]UJR87258.1 Ornithine cyclodeaminase [Sandaracinus amylolyticus]